MDEAPSHHINDRIAARVRSLRADLGISLETLAARSGVSRSALSLIERAESSPTAVVLDRIATGLGVVLASLFNDASAKALAEPLSRFEDQPVWKDPQSGYVRRSVSAGNFPSPIQIVEVSFPPGARVAYETGPRSASIHQQVWMLDGAMDLTVGSTTHRLKSGDCLSMKLDQPTVFRNPTRKCARYAVVLVTEPSARG